LLLGGVVLFISPTAFLSLNCHGRWNCLTPTSGVLETIVRFCKSFSVDHTSCFAATWIVDCEIRTKLNLPKDSATGAVDRKHLAFRKVRDDSQ
jgi:hypothetical protein